MDAISQCDTVFLDLSKAFDSVPHDLLLHKIKSFGIAGHLLSWFQKYLHKIYQGVVREGTKSKTLPVLSGVPQGSILGPLLFTMYINDLPETTDLDIYLYADDAKVTTPIHSKHGCEQSQNA